MAEARFRNARLYKADLTGANGERADFTAADLTEAVLTDAVLPRAEMEGAVLVKSKLVGSYLHDMNMARADMAEARFEPALLDGLVFTGANGLSTLEFAKVVPIVELRRMAREAGLRNEERALTAALRKYRREGTPIHDRIFEYALFDFPTDSGENPWKALGLLMALSFFYTIIYVIALCKGGQDGIFKQWHPDRIRKDLGTEDPEPLRGTAFAALKMAFFFSMLSAFSVGWRELHVGSWINRMQQQEYTLRATGWVRTVSGSQSLLSVYLFGLWAVTYFGRPFN